MKIIIVGQEPLEVSGDEAKAVMQSIISGAEFIIVGSEYVKASAIMGVRNDDQETLPTSQWGALPEGRMRHFFDDRREAEGDGYRKFREMKKKILGRKLS